MCYSVNISSVVSPNSPRAKRIPFPPLSLYAHCLCRRPPALSSYIPSLDFVIASPNSVIVPLFCHHPQLCHRSLTLSSSPCSVIAPLLRQKILSQHQPPSSSRIGHQSYFITFPFSENPFGEHAKYYAWNAQVNQKCRDLFRPDFSEEYIVFIYRYHYYQIIISIIISHY